MLNVSKDCIDALLAPVRFIKPQVLIYFNGDKEEPVDVTGDLISLSTLEEVTSSRDLPFGKVSFNELYVQLDNFHKQYSITNNASPYANQLVSGVKVVVSYQVEISDGIFESIEAGIFYTDAWSAASASDTASVTCFDKLSLYATNQISRFKMRKNISIKDAFALLFESASVAKSEYIIDPTITGTLSYFWGTGLTLVECLDSLSMQTGVNIFVDKLGIIRVQEMHTINSTSLTLKDDNVIISANGEPSYANVYSGINITYKQHIESSAEELMKITGQVLKPGLNTLNDLVFKAGPVVSLSCITMKAPTGVYVQQYSNNDQFVSIAIQNNTETDVTVDIVVSGYKIATADITALVEQPNGTNNIMDVTLPMVCSREYALALASKVLQAFTLYMPTISLDIRALPHLDIGDSINIDSPSAVVSGRYIIQSIDVTYQEGLMGTIVARAW